MQSPVKIWRNQKKIRSLLGKTGVIQSWTVVYVPPQQLSSFAPYPVVLVCFDSGISMVAQLVDWEPKHLVRGQRVKTVIRRVTNPNDEGVIPYGVKVKPI